MKISFGAVIKSNGLSLSPQVLTRSHGDACATRKQLASARGSKFRLGLAPTTTISSRKQYTKKFATPNDSTTTNSQVAKMKYIHSNETLTIPEGGEFFSIPPVPYTWRTVRMCCET